MFDDLKKIAFDPELNRTNTAPIQFDTVSKEVVGSAETRIGRVFNAQIKRFWTEVGSGRIGSKLDGSSETGASNTVLDPSSAADAFLGEDDYADYPHRGTFIPFFQVDGHLFFALSDDGGCVIFPDDHDLKPIADSLEDFMRKLVNDPRFYSAYVSEVAHRLLSEAEAIANKKL